MTILDTALDPLASSCAENRKAVLACLDEVATALDQAREGGGERYVTRHHARGKLLPRERIELLLDQDSPFLELSPVAAWGTDFPVGASVVTGIGAVCGAACVVVANDPTVRGGAVNPYTMAKISRAEQIAAANRLPLIHLLESTGGDPTGSVLAMRGWAGRVSGVAVVLGDTTGDSSYAPGRHDYTIVLRDRAHVLHATRCGLADFLAEDERDALRLARLCVRRAGWGRRVTVAPQPGPPPRHDPEDLLAVPSADPQVPFDPREVLARILDGSEFDEYRPAYGGGLVAGWGQLHGYPIRVLAHTGAPLGPAEAQKAERFAQLARDPLVVLENAAGGIQPEHAGPFTGPGHRPHVTVTVGAWAGPAGPGTGEPRFRFAWPNAQPAAGHVAAQLSTAQPPTALARSGRVLDDGVIDPRDTRTVLGLCLSTLDNPTGEET